MKRHAQDTGQDKPESNDGRFPVKAEMRVVGDADLMISMAELASQLRALGIQASFRAEKLSRPDSETPPPPSP